MKRSLIIITALLFCLITSSFAQQLHGYIDAHKYLAYRKDLKTINYIPANDIVEVHFSMNFTEFSWELLNSAGVPEVNYDRNVLTFKNSGVPVGYTIPFRFTYKLKGSSDEYVVDCNFILTDDFPSINSFERINQD